MVSFQYWSIFGYFAALPFVDLFIEQLTKISRFRNLVEGSQKSRIALHYRRHTDWTLAFLGPLIEIWVAHLIGSLAGMAMKEVLYAAH